MAKSVTLGRVVFRPLAMSVALSFRLCMLLMLSTRRSPPALSSADLSSADLSSADLSSADFSDVNMAYLTFRCWRWFIAAGSEWRYGRAPQLSGPHRCPTACCDDAVAATEPRAAARNSLHRRDRAPSLPNGPHGRAVRTGWSSASCPLRGCQRSRRLVVVEA